jgi:hypothetical protein
LRRPSKDVFNPAEVPGEEFAHEVESPVHAAPQSVDFAPKVIRSLVQAGRNQGKAEEHGRGVHDDGHADGEIERPVTSFRS